MKKLILIISFVLLSLIAFSQTHIFQTTQFSAKFTGYEWSDWVPSSLDITWNLSIARIIIYSADTQIIDYQNEITKTYTSYTVTRATATDREHLPILIEFTTYITGDSYLKISYSDIQYQYKLIPHQNHN